METNIESQSVSGITWNLKLGAYLEVFRENLLLKPLEGGKNRALLFLLNESA